MFQSVHGTLQIVKESWSPWKVQIRKPHDSTSIFLLDEQHPFSASSTFSYFAFFPTPQSFQEFPHLHDVFSECVTEVWYGGRSPIYHSSNELYRLVWSMSISLVKNQLSSSVLTLSCVTEWGHIRTALPKPHWSFQQIKKLQHTQNLIVQLKKRTNKLNMYKKLKIFTLFSWFSSSLSQVAGELFL